MLIAVAPALAQPRGALADLIRAGNRSAALDRIRSGADVNEAQPDGTRPIHWAVYKVDYELIGALIAKICLEKKIEKVVFDRNGYLYHGRVKAVAEAAREDGLQF